MEETVQNSITFRASSAVMEYQSLFSLVVLSLFIFFILKLLRHPRPKQNLPPEPWRLPIVGHVHHLIGSMPHHGVRDLALKYGALMHLQLGEVSTIVVSSPLWAKEVLTTQDITFSNRPETLMGEIVSYHNTNIAFAPYGKYWRQLRKICTLELFSAKKVKSFQALREEECQNLVQSIRSLGSGSLVNLSENVFNMTATLLCRAAFGKGIKDQREFIEIIKEIIRLTQVLDVAYMFPSNKLLHHLSGNMGKLTRIHKKADKIISNIMSEHPGSTPNETLLDVLLRLKDSVEFPLTSDNVKAVILDMFGAGIETSSLTVEWAISELLRHPRAMEKAQAEVREALKGKEKIQEDDIQDLSYLKLVIKETLRLHPPLPFLGRASREPCKLGGYDIPQKATLILNVFAINRDPQYWKDSESFIPERFESSSINIMGEEYEYLPFGAGRRMCPGAALGLANIVLPLAHLLYYFNWKLPNGERSEDLDMNESFGATVGRKNELVLVPIF